MCFRIYEYKSDIAWMHPVRAHPFHNYHKTATHMVRPYFWYAQKWSNNERQHGKWATAPPHVLQWLMHSVFFGAKIPIRLFTPHQQTLKAAVQKLCPQTRHGLDQASEGSLGYVYPWTLSIGVTDRTNLWGTIQSQAEEAMAQLKTPAIYMNFALDHGHPTYSS